MRDGAGKPVDRAAQPALCARDGFEANGRRRDCVGLFISGEIMHDLIDFSRFLLKTRIAVCSMRQLPHHNWIVLQRCSIRGTRRYRRAHDGDVWY